MKKLAHLLLTLIPFWFGTLAAHKHHEVVIIEEEPSADIIVIEAPPQEIAEVCSPCPGVNYCWVKGRWHWKHGWVWVPGRWEARPYSGATWVPGHWDRGHHGWVWVRGHWAN